MERGLDLPGLTPSLRAEPGRGMAGGRAGCGGRRGRAPSRLLCRCPPRGGCAGPGARLGSAVLCGSGTARCRAQPRQSEGRAGP